MRLSVGCLWAEAKAAEGGEGQAWHDDYKFYYGKHCCAANWQQLLGLSGSRNAVIAAVVGVQLIYIWRREKHSHSSTPSIAKLVKMPEPAAG